MINTPASQTHNTQTHNTQTNNSSTTDNQSLKNTETGTQLPNFVNLEKWEDVGYTWSGAVVPKALPRLAKVIPDAYQDEPINVNFELKREGQLLTLLMAFNGEIWVTCQRCLEPLNIDVTHDSQLILLQDEEQESLVDEADDFVLLEELLGDQLENKKGERFLPVAKLIEDDILLDVPLSAKHDDCEMAVDQVGEIEEEAAENPFAALADLKGKL